MAHDVFISYSSKDKPTADAACAVLESKGIRCWIAPRDITPGADWGESIVDAISGARAFVLVFSSHANASQQIKREVERAVNHGLAIIPLRIEDVQPAKTLEYFISTPHWLDAFNPPLEKHLNYLAEVIRHILEGKAPPPAPSPSTVQTLYGFDRRLIAGAGLAALILVALGVNSVFGSRPATFVGKWTASKVSVEAGAIGTPGLSYATDIFAKPALEGSDIAGSLDVSDLGQYHYVSSAKDTGTVTASGNDGLIFTSDINHVSTQVQYFLLEAQMAQSMVSAYGGNSGDMGLVLNPPFPMVQATLVGMPLGKGFGSGIDKVSGTWRFRSFGNAMMPTTTVELQITNDGRYRFKGEVDEHGMMTAADGKWTRTPQVGPPASGTYVFDSSDKVTCAAANGTTVWVRAD